MLSHLGCQLGSYLYVSWLNELMLKRIYCVSTFLLDAVQYLLASFDGCEQLVVEKNWTVLCFTVCVCLSLLVGECVRVVRKDR